MDQDFRQRMSERSDEDIISILTIERYKYRPEAYEAAKEEFVRRGLTIEALVEGIKQIEELEEQYAEYQRNYVSNVRRIANYLIDSFSYLLVYSVLTFVFALSIGQEPHVGVHMFFFVLARFGYFMYMETVFQQTLGKHFTKTKVVRKDGEVPSRNDIFIRTICRFIPFDAWFFLNAGYCFHDQVSGTRVVPIDS